MKLNHADLLAVSIDAPTSTILTEAGPLGATPAALGAGVAAGSALVASFGAGVAVHEAIND